jgi:predicted transcriptional regulator of viral defense system
MNFWAFQQAFGDRDVVGIEDIFKVFPQFDRRRLVEWQQKGYLQKLINKYYTWPNKTLTEGRLFFTANRLCSPSYVSGWSALRWYGCIPEGVYLVTSVTTQQTHHFDTFMGRFRYQHLKPSLFFGYEPVQVGTHNFRMASAEKALLDTLYLTPSLKDKEDVEGLRLNWELMRTRYDLAKLNAYSEAMANKRVSQLIREINKQLAV